MYDLFKESHPNIKYSRSLYRDIFRSEFNLTFCPPRSESCSYCDELYIHLVAAETEEEQKRISAQSTLQHRKAKTAYKVLHEDVVMYCSVQHFIIPLCFTYNQFVHNMGTKKPFIFVWNESVAKLGSSGVTACILKYTEMHFEPLKVGETVSLVVWSDRRIAQNNNWRCVALYHYLIEKKYFTTIDQKFLVSGHCFLLCDRDFALIERRKKKKSTVYHSKQWLEVIVNASPAFSAYYMDKENFIDLSAIEGMFKKQPDFKITSFHWIQFSSEERNTVQTRVSHNTLQPCHSYVTRPLPRGRKHLRPLSTVLPQLYEEAIAIKKAKKKKLARHM
ncbi:hypothetical protein PR048_025234 [Dryococelus australis]|uniref:DUF7869 domain-containing protein n=1 Tax=Dryococelus australis TaxID=614101 RepID=A0ABQ9GQT1_9NEOP|nr:hypothetical protein PR048_025234 [Dryococelus australis]